MCKTCGCEIFEYCKRPEKDSRLTEGVSEEEMGKRAPWEAENGWNGSFGLNALLLLDIGRYLADVHGLEGEGVQGEKKGTLKGYERSDEHRYTEPIYQVRL